MNNDYYQTEHYIETLDHLNYLGYEEKPASICPGETHMTIVLNPKEKIFWISGKKSLVHNELIAKTFNRMIKPTTLNQIREWNK